MKRYIEIDGVRYDMFHWFGCVLMELAFDGKLGNYCLHPLNTTHRCLIDYEKEGYQTMFPANCPARPATEGLTDTLICDGGIKGNGEEV